MDGTVKAFVEGLKLPVDFTQESFQASLCNSNQIMKITQYLVCLPFFVCLFNSFIKRHVNG